MEFKLKEGTKPICLIPYPVPKVHEEMIIKEVACLVILGLLERKNESEWGAPYFSQPKP